MIRIDNLKILLTKQQKKLKVVDFGKFLVYLYLRVFLLGLLLFVIAKIFPFINTNTCIKVGGNIVCTYLGLFISVFPSLPGYLIVGTVLKPIYWSLPTMITYIMVIGVSSLIYFLIGNFINQYISLKNDKEKKLKLIITAIFVVLFFFVILLRIF